jgi:hypothetical protein
MAAFKKDYDGLQERVTMTAFKTSRDILVVGLDDLAQGLVPVHEKSAQGHTRVGGDVMKRLKIGKSSAGAKFKRGPRGKNLDSDQDGHKPALRVCKRLVNTRRSGGDAMLLFGTCTLDEFLLKLIRHCRR